MERKHPYYGKSMSTNFLGSPHTMGFVVFFCTMGNWWRNPRISHMMKYTMRCNKMRKKHPHYGKSMSTNFPGSPHTMGFVTFSSTMGNWYGNPCISHIIKFIIGWESNGKRAPILWEKYEYQFPRFSSYDWFFAFFVLWEIDGKIHAFSLWCYWLIFFLCFKAVWDSKPVWVHFGSHLNLL